MKVRAIRRFFDRKEDVRRSENDEFEVTADRANTLVKKGFVEVLMQSKQKETK